MSEVQKYEAVIGLEVHAELKTGTKIFCSCRNSFGASPNTHVCPVCLGMPGTLPVLDGRAVELAVRAGIALECQINRRSWFDRKHYFYPDLPKGYQITQYEMPICLGGFVPIETAQGKKKIRLTRIHMEEDAAKLTHRGDETLVDYNRAGVPLIEIVSEPDMRSAEEAKAYINSLRRILAFIGVSDCKMNEGSLRCDVNVSVRPAGSEWFGVKCEIKNINSVNYVGRALEYEISRQISLIEAGGAVESETRRFNEDTGKTETMRKKETTVDYRYMTEENLPVLALSEEYINNVRNTMPRLPDDEASHLVSEYGIKEADAALLTQSPEISAYFTECASLTEYHTVCANLFVGEVLTHADENNLRYISPEALAQICDMFGGGKIVSGAAKELVHLSAESGRKPCDIAAERKMLKITDTALLTQWAMAAVEKNAKSAADYKAGKSAAIKALLGFVMRESKGGADPVEAERILKEILDR